MSRGARHIASLLWADGGLLVQIVGPPALIAGALSVGASLAQIGWAFTPKALELNWRRLSPASGLARLKPTHALPELLKALFGIAAVGTVAYLLVSRICRHHG